MMNIFQMRIIELQNYVYYRKTIKENRQTQAKYR